MRHTAKQWTGLSLVLTVILASTPFGCGGGEDNPVMARDLATGEVRSFPSTGDVPQGWRVCDDASCNVPADVRCEDLGQGECQLNPACRLKALWCAGSTPGHAPGGTGAEEPQTVSDQCEYTCLPKLPLLCDELNDKDQCGARTDCEWAAGPCAGTCSSDGTCTSACSFVCQTKTPPLCRELAEGECKSRSDCEWGPNSCPPCSPEGPGGGVCGCQPSCQPAATPDPCGPAECGPALTMSTYLCPDGTTVAGPTGQCLRNVASQCGWEVVRCAPMPQATCDPTTCGKNPYGVPSYTCSDGKNTAGPQCVLGAEGVCTWEMISCPQT
jgi:hypothetical protein